MRLLRALALFVLALVVTLAPVAHARAVAGVGPHENHVVATHAVMGHAAHDCDDRGSGHPMQTIDACQMACCFLPAQIPARTDVIRTAAFRAIRYADVAAFLPGQAPAPDHGVPRNA